ncbi:uncharacterized protein LOC117177996 [Belonocnema kinseyi]|uniref:uncharacterized protein LOC117177996 n=1 Tax=Belonocnema kinseyi TaxID=2817044 RepID=UPI00143D1F92|nr:uncharacterized protein LOC117177996 [Belonocnema kinseyi]
MFKHREICLLLEIFLCSTFLLSAFADEECDKTKCPGPLAYYRDLRCKPIYKNLGDCCAHKYDCSHLKERSTKKCYINDNVYEIGDKLKDADALPCVVGCTCVEGVKGMASFSCASISCPPITPNPGCYFKHSADKCCPDEEVCPKPEEKAKCVVGGKTYEEGDYFDVREEPEKACYCKPGYKGENVEPFCYTPKGNFCGTELRSSYEINQKCAPVYYYQQSPQKDCSVAYRCQNMNDAVIRNSQAFEKSTEDESALCTFGNMSMRIGDELNQETDYSSICVKCKCEVPPIPTCQRLPDDKCEA